MAQFTGIFSKLFVVVILSLFFISAVYYAKAANLLKDALLAKSEIPGNPLSPQGRRIPRDMLPLNPGIAERFAALTKGKREQDDPEVVQFIRDAIIEDRRPFLPKMSYNLYQTPQAVEVEKIFKKK
ncbi:hypothetical protein CAPTEDRAFT_196703, partial [Capitella teleta]